MNEKKLKIKYLCNEIVSYDKTFVRDGIIYVSDDSPVYENMEHEIEVEGYEYEKISDKKYRFYKGKDEFFCSSVIKVEVIDGMIKF